MFLKPGILLRALSHKSTSFRPIIFVIKAPVIRRIRTTKTKPEYGIEVSKLRRASGRSVTGTRLLITSKKNLITKTVNASGIQNKSPDIR